jgi:mannosyltransferase OCH1-like enzyme
MENSENKIYKIPKTIHYCWFGSKPLPAKYTKFIASWKEKMPDYEFKLWNESNFDVNICEFTKQVAQSQKWGFIVDYIRAWAVYNYGGIYLDTDVEVLRSFDDLLENECFAGFEDEKFVNPGSIFGGQKNCAVAKELLEFYSTYNFIKENGKPNTTPSPIIFTNLLLKHGLQQNNSFQKLENFTAYPTEFFCPATIFGKHQITKNTFSIHHFENSWGSPAQKFRGTIKKILGSKVYDAIFNPIKRLIKKKI